MPYKEDESALDRFSAHYIELKALHPDLRLYALIDCASMPAIRRQRIDEVLEPVTRYPLYSDTGLDSLTETGPFLIACPGFEGDELRDLHRSLLRLAGSDHRCVSWLWATHDVQPLIAHLQTLLHARLGPEDEDAWFFFHQPAYLPVLHRALPDETKRYMFGPCLAWWCLDMHGEPVELAGENLPLPAAWEALPVPADVVKALHREGAPAQTRAWLKKGMPDVLGNGSANEQLSQLAPLIDRAFGYDITSKLDLSVYAAFGLRYGATYDDHPALQDVLTRFGNRKPALIDAYAALGNTVWNEVQDTANRRADDAATQAYRAECQKYGVVYVRVRLINRTDYQHRQIKLSQPSGRFMGVSKLGDIAAAFQETRVDIPEARIPVPGMTVTVTWITPTGWEATAEVEVTGELPRSKGAGLAIIEFERNHQVYISMHAEEPKPVRQW